MVKLTETEFQQLPAPESLTVGDSVTCYHYRNILNGERWYESGRQSRVTGTTKTTIYIGDVTVKRKTGKSSPDSRYFWRKTQ